MCDTVQADNINQFIEQLSQLSVGENSASVKAIMCAAKVSRDNSPIFVFSDDSATDQELLGEVEAIVAEKNLEINILSESSQTSRRSAYNRKDHKMKQSHSKRQISNVDVYQELADFSDGQNVQIPVEEISEIGPVITYSATQSTNTIFRHSDITFGSTQSSFMVNSYAYQILICANGQNINVSVNTPLGKSFNNCVTV